MISQARSFRPVFKRPLQFVALILSFYAVTRTVVAQAPPAGSNWDHLKALPTHTRLHVSADNGGATCYLLSVDDAALVCGRHTFPRSEVKSIKLTRYGVSYGVGAGIGAGVGAAIGIAAATDGKNNFFRNDKGPFAAVGASTGIAIGAVVAGPADLLRGPTVYRRQ